MARSLRWTLTTAHRCGSERPAIIPSGHQRCHDWRLQNEPAQRIRCPDIRGGNL